MQYITRLYCYSSYVPTSAVASQRGSVRTESHETSVEIGLHCMAGLLMINCDLVRMNIQIMVLYVLFRFRKSKT